MSLNAAAQPRLFRFGPFELDNRTGELRNGETRIRLGGQPAQILEMLLERRGEPVFREEIRARLWPNDTIVEFDHGINAAVRQLRNALRDSAENPRYIETVARRGYRFIVPIEEAVPSAPAVAEPLDTGNLEGRTLSHYRIGLKLGSGGMGVVYRAEDLNLGRPVAMKFLPCPARDLPEPVRRRFEREARAVAALSHPHICTVFGLEDLSGEPVIVMELLEGQTLATRLAHGALPPAEAIPLAIQMTGALAAAHRAGLTHRDFKPANVMLTPSGVKLLDFGLVKADQSAFTSPPSETPATVEGTILGTPHYMSPEQAQGQETDWRTDIFSFGAVLYEMLTGRRAFEAEDSAKVMSAILERDPPGFEEINPPSLQPVLVRCLARDPDERWQSATDLRAALQWIIGEVTTGSSRPASPLPTPVPLSPQVAHRPLWPWLLAAASFSGFALSAVLYFRAPASLPPETRTDIVTPATATPGSFALSSDGRRLAYVASTEGVPRLFVRELDSTSAQSLPGTEGARYPFWSPDGRSIAFFAGFSVKRTDLSGREPTVLASIGATSAGGSWSEAGLIAFPSGPAGRINRVPASGGESSLATAWAEGQRSHRAPRFLPGGSQFFFTVYGSEPAIWLGSIAGAPPRRLAPIQIATDSSPEYLAPGWLARVVKGTLIAQRFDAASGALSTQVSIADHVGVDQSTSAGAFSASQSGAIAWRTGVAADLRQLIWFDRRGRKLGTVGGPETSGLFNPQISPDGKRVGITRGPVGDTGDIWIYDGDQIRRLTFDPADDRNSVWSPDGKQIVFMSSRGGTADLYIKASSGTGEERLLLHTALAKRPNAWSPDGRFILYQTDNYQTDNAAPVIEMVSVTGERLSFAPGGTPVLGREAVFSPDGKWIAYAGTGTSREEIFVRRLSGRGGQWQVSTAGGRSPRWPAGGTELYYLAPDRNMMAVPIKAQGDTLLPGTPVVLFPTRIVAAGSRQQYDVARDGRFLIDSELDDASSEPIHLLLNWRPPAK